MESVQRGQSCVYCLYKCLVVCLHNLCRVCCAECCCRAVLLALKLCPGPSRRRFPSRRGAGVNFVPSVPLPGRTLDCSLLIPIQARVHAPYVKTAAKCAHVGGVRHWVGECVTAAGLTDLWLLLTADRVTHLPLTISDNICTWCLCRLREWSHGLEHAHAPVTGVLRAALLPSANL